MLRLRQCGVSCTLDIRRGGHSVAQAQKAREEALQAERNEKAGKRIDPVDNINRVSSDGTSASYLLRRLARNAPDTLAAYERGEFPSVRAAALHAGVLKVPTALDLLYRAWHFARLKTP